MLTLTDDQRGLLDYLAEQVHELSATAHVVGGERASNLMAEAEELTSIRARIITRAHGVEAAAQMQLPLDIKRAA